MNKTFKDKELKLIADAFSEECWSFLYEQLAKYGEEAVGEFLLAYYLRLYKESQAEEDRLAVESLMTLMPDEYRQLIVSHIKEYLRQFFDQSLSVKILTNDFPSRYELDRKEKANRGAGL